MPRLRTPLPNVSRFNLVAVALAAGLCLLGTFAGCEKPTDLADRDIENKVNESRGAAASGEGGLPTVPQSLNAAVGVQSASPQAKAEALSHLAQNEVQRAAALLARADRDEVTARRLVAEINRLGSRLQANNNVVGGLQKMEPSKVKAAIQEHRGAAQGEKDPVWKKHEKGPVAALKGVDEKQAQLEEEIGKLEQQSKDLASQRAKLIADAERLEKESEAAQGRQSVELFNQSADARKKAADLAVQIEGLDGKLVPLRQDLKLAQGTKEILNKSVQSFDAQLQASDQNWAAVQKQVQAMTEMSRALLGPAPNEPPAPPAEAAPGPQPEAEDPAAAAAAAPPPAPEATARAATRPGTGGGSGSGGAAPTTVVGKLRWLNALTTSIQAQRAEAESLLNSALQHYTSAGSEADKLVRDLNAQINGTGGGQRPERPSWQRMVELYNPALFKLKQAGVQLMIAGLQRDRAGFAAARAGMAKNIGDAVKQARLNAPAELGPHGVDAEAKASQDAAREAYKSADELLTGVIEGPKTGETMTAAAKSAHMLRLAGLYGQAQLAAQTDPKAAGQILAQARQVATQGGTDVDVPKDALPVFILDVLELRPPPTTGPATRPARTTPAPAPAPTTPTPAPTTPTRGPTPATPPQPEATDAAQPSAQSEPAQPPAEQPARPPADQPAQPAAQPDAAPQPDAAAQPDAAPPDAGAQPEPDAAGKAPAGRK